MFCSLSSTWLHNCKSSQSHFLILLHAFFLHSCSPQWNVIFSSVLLQSFNDVFLCCAKSQTWFTLFCLLSLLIWSVISSSLITAFPSFGYAAPLLQTLVMLRVFIHPIAVWNTKLCCCRVSFLCSIFTQGEVHKEFWTLWLFCIFCVVKWACVDLKSATDISWLHSVR